MTVATFIAMVVFALVASGTPGPNTIMLFTSGVNFGLRRTVPHMVGIIAGFLALIAAVALGLGVLLQAEPRLRLAMKVAGGAYMLWLAWRIARSAGIDRGKSPANPLSFGQAALFQWVNPKAWLMASTAISTYTTDENYTLTASFVLLAFLIAGVPSVFVWAAFGDRMSRYLSDPVILRRFNITMALALVLSLWPMLT